MERTKLIVIMCLASIAHLCVGSMLIMAALGKDVAPSLVSMAGVSVGALAGILVDPHPSRARNGGAKEVPENNKEEHV